MPFKGNLGYDPTVENLQRMKISKETGKRSLYSVIIPAYNEEDLLPQTLISLTEAMDKVKYKGEIIVVDNNSTDRTSQVAKDHGALVVFEAKNQISRARNAGAARASGRFLIFLDADTILSSQILNQAISNLLHGDCCGGGAFLSFGNAPRRSRRKLASLLNYGMKKFKLAAGCFIYCLDEGFKEAGGFSERLYASEEIGFVIRLKKWGRKNENAFKIIGNHNVVTSSRKLEHPIKLMLPLFVSLLCPFFVYYRSLCGFWYKRAPK